ncbi:insecticidal delta-endotoxin Cry8Ea1 family protein [Bacillus thuringiensis]|uniref:Crystaline entomocidal protoxin n=1 Tax=Bacillus thuringiensis TaxID=1428 RepID=A0A4P8DY45_BACTU|nr:insecticidal delta-endotoxin Cry8Ea1 family protein [Bacillus thuringiensis]PQQ47537.1 hypothetical protein C6A34_12080 [Bacillus thuringiensis]QCO31629.1 crystal protein [Bacillus thuringiensis]
MEPYAVLSNEQIEKQFIKIAEALKDAGVIKNSMDLINKFIKGNYDVEDIAGYIADVTTGLLAFGIKSIPGIGPFLSTIFTGLVSILLGKNSEDLWRKIETYVNQVVEEKLAEYDSALVQKELEGLQKIILDFYESLQRYNSNHDTKSITPEEDLFTQFVATHKIFINRLPQFQKEKYQIHCLPLYTQAANLDIVLLHDIVKNSDKFNLDEQVKSSYMEQLSNKIIEYQTYITEVYQKGLQKIKDKDPLEFHEKYYKPILKKNEVRETLKWQIINNYERGMQMSVLNIAQSWRYLNLEKFPDGIKYPRNTEIYSNIIGIPYPWGSYSYEKLADKLINDSFEYQGPFADIIIKSQSRIDSVSCSFINKNADRKVLNKGGDGGQESDPIEFDSINKFVEAKGATGLTPYSMLLVKEDGEKTPEFGSNKNEYDHPYSFEYSGYYLSAVNGFGINTDPRFRSLDALVYVYKPDVSIRDLNTSIVEIPVQDYYDTTSADVEKEVMLNGNVLNIPSGESVTFNVDGNSLEGDSDLLITYSTDTKSSITIGVAEKNKYISLELPETDNLNSTKGISGHYIEKFISKFNLSENDKINIKVNIGKIKLFSIIIKNFSENIRGLNGTYQIVTALNDFSVIDLNVTTKDAILYENHYGDNQKWYFEYDSNKNAYQIKSMWNKNDVLTWDSNGNSKNVISELNTQKAEQYWLLSQQKDGYYIIRSKKNPVMVLDVLDASTNNLTKIQVHPQHEPNNGFIKAQKFLLTEEVKSLRGTYQIVTSLNNSSVIDLNVTTNDITLYENHHGENQEWNFEYDSNKNAYQIKSMWNNNYVLTWNGSGDKKNIVGDSNTNRDEQYWVVERKAEKYIISNKKAPSLVLDVDDSHIDNGTIVKAFKRNGNKAQIFDLIQVSKS